MAKVEALERTSAQNVSVGGAGVVGGSSSRCFYY